MNNYLEKYIKYKKKYLFLRAQNDIQNNLTGGDVNFEQMSEIYSQFLTLFKVDLIEIRELLFHYKYNSKFNQQIAIKDGSKSYYIEINYDDDNYYFYLNELNQSLNQTHINLLYSYSDMNNVISDMNTENSSSIVTIKENKLSFHINDPSIDNEYNFLITKINKHIEKYKKVNSFITQNIEMLEILISQITILFNSININLAHYTIKTSYLEIKIIIDKTTQKNKYPEKKKYSDTERFIFLIINYFNACIHYMTTCQNKQYNQDIKDIQDTLNDKSSYSYTLKRDYDDITDNDSLANTNVPIKCTNSPVVIFTKILLPNIQEKTNITDTEKTFLKN